MKFLIRLFIVALTACGFVLSQDVVKNPSRSASPNARRIVILEESLSIDDKSGEFFFKSPRSPVIAPDGSLFILDDDLLLEFSPEGKLLRNYFKKGQGPGELENVWNYLLEEGSLFIEDASSRKIVVFDRTGALVEEIKLPAGLSGPRLISLSNNDYYFGGMKIQREEGGLAMIQNLTSLSRDGQTLTEILLFPKKDPLPPRGSTMLSASRTVLNATPYKNRWMFVNETAEYSIELVDLEEKKIIRNISRDYDRVKSSPKVEGMAGEANKASAKTSSPEFKNDIAGVTVRGDNLWVFTSTVDKRKGTLIDVFDFEGRYLDSFFLLFEGIDGAHSFTGTNVTFSADTAVFIVSDEDGLVRIVKSPFRGF